MQQAALAVLTFAGAWLIAIGLVMTFKPEEALRLLSLTATSHRVNMAEQIPRFLAGAAMVVRSEASKTPDLFDIIGIFVAGTSIILLLIPLRWHNGYALWWSRRLSRRVVRFIGPFSMLAGLSLIFAAL